MLEAQTRLVMIGHVGPDGELPVGDGGFRSDTPICAQFAFHTLCTLTVRKHRRMGTIDCKASFLTGIPHDRDMCVRPPKDCFPGVLSGSLLKSVKRRLWFT